MNEVVGKKIQEIIMCKCYIYKWIIKLDTPFKGNLGMLIGGSVYRVSMKNCFKTMSKHRKETILMAVFMCLRDETLDQVVTLPVQPKLFYLGYQIIYFQVV